MATSARLDELKKKFDENPRRYFAPLANEYRKQGDLAQAIALCRTHLPNQPGHISGNIVLAQALYESRELAESRQAFEAALDLDPENLIALRYLGDIAREQGALEAAQGWYQRVLDADPRNDEIAQLMRAVEAEASAARAELASRPTPTANDAIPEPAPVSALATETLLHDKAVPAILDLEPTVQVTEAITETFQTPTIPLESIPTDALVLSDVAPQAPMEQAAEAEDPFFGSAALGELEAVAEPTIDDWFSAPAEPAEPSAPEAFFPDLSEAAALPSAPAPEPEAIAEAWSDDFLAPAAPAEPVELAAASYDADPEGDTLTFRVDQAQATDDAVAGTPPSTDFQGFELTESADLAESATASAPEWLSAEPAAIPEPEAAPASSWDEPEHEWSAPAADAPEAEPLAAAAEAEPEAVVEAEFEAEVVAEQVTEPAVAEGVESSPSPWESVLSVEPAIDEPVSGAFDTTLDPFEGRADITFAETDPVLGRTPAFNTPVAEEPPAPFVTETMAELYLQQGFNEEALAIYRQLLAQSPDDEALRRRVSALEHGAESAVVEAVFEAPAPAATSVRAFFARFATRRRREGVAPAPEPAPNVESGYAGGGVATLAGVATREEALTQPDEEPGSLSDVFGSAPLGDAQAATSLASAFGVAPSVSGGELSLGHLFRDVEARSPGAVTPGAAPAVPDEAAAVQSHADIEQFTAWLEGLKKK